MSIITFKGTREGLSVTLGEGEWREVMNELALQLARPQAQSFFRGARVLLETGHRTIDVTQIEELIALLSQYDMTLGSVLGERRSQDAFDQVRATIPPPEIPPENKMPVPIAAPSLGQETPPDGMAALLIHRTVRSGQRYRYAGTIVVIGDVNPGAELIADGDIIVWGKLRGVVHSGARGNDNATISALVLAPTQLRIGKFIARAPDDKRPRNAPAEIARVRNGNIVLEPWNVS
jgi:septum site-determining protein MinC